MRAAQNTAVTLALALALALALLPALAQAQATWAAAAPCAAADGAAGCAATGAIGSGSDFVQRQLGKLQANGFGAAPIGGLSPQGLPGADLSSGGGSSPAQQTSTASGVTANPGTPTVAAWQLLAVVDSAGSADSAPYASWWLPSTYASSGNPLRGVDHAADAVRALAVPSNVCATLRNSLQSTADRYNASTTNLCNTSSNDATVPEPGTLALAGLALAGALAAMRRRR